MPERYRYSIDEPPVPNFLKMMGGQAFGLHVLNNKAGMFAAITNYGGRLVSLLVPDSQGKRVEVIEGFDGLDHKLSYKFSDEEYLQYVGSRLNNLTAYRNGVEGVFFDTNQTNDMLLELTYSGKEKTGDSLVPSKIKVTYVLTADNRLKITCETMPAALNKPGLTGGISFNLNGAGTESLLGHLVQINADNYLPVDGHLIPTGEIGNVGGTPFDFRKAAAICARINDNNEQLRNGKGFNHFFVLNKHSSRTPVARVKGDKTGIIMELCTEADGLRFYCGSTPHDKRNIDGSSNGFCLDVLSLPALSGNDYPELAGFEANQSYKWAVIYRFKN